MSRSVQTRVIGTHNRVRKEVQATTSIQQMKSQSSKPCVPNMPGHVYLSSFLREYSIVGFQIQFLCRHGQKHQESSIEATFLCSCERYGRRPMSRVEELLSRMAQDQARKLRGSAGLLAALSIRRLLVEDNLQRLLWLSGKRCFGRDLASVNS